MTQFVLTENQQKAFEECAELISEVAAKYAAQFGNACGFQQEDLEQDLYIELWKEFQNYDVKRSNPKSFAKWVLRTRAVYVCKRYYTFHKYNKITAPDLQAKEKEEQGENDAVEVNPVFSYDPDIERQVILKEAVEKLFATATDEERAVLEDIMYSYDDKWRVRDTARRLGTYDNKVHRMIKRFRNRLIETYGENPLLLH